MSALEMKVELGKIKDFINNLNKKNFHVGDKINSRSLVRGYNRYGEEIYYDGSDLLNMATMGVLGHVGREFVLWNDDPFGENPTIDAEEILKPNFHGTVYTRNVYEINFDSFADYISALIN